IDDPWRTAETFETGPGEYDWDRDAAARWFVHAAKDHGVEDFVAFVNSPPRRLTANGHTYGDEGTSSLPAEHHEEFTRYLLDVVRHFRDEEGIDFRFLRPGARRIGAELEAVEQTEGVMARIPFVEPEIATGTAPGDVLFRVEDPAGDDHGPGTYRYPDDAAFTPGSFDLLSVEATDDGEDVLFAIRLGAELTDPWGDSPVGYDLQNIDIYVDTRAEGGVTELLPGRRAQVADGFAWDRAVFATGRTDVAEQDVAEKVSPEMQEALFVPVEDRQSIDGNTLTLRVPTSFLGRVQPGWAVQVLVTGSDGSAESD